MNVFVGMKVRLKSDWSKTGVVRALHVSGTNSLLVQWEGRKFPKEERTDEIEENPLEVERNQRMMEQIMEWGGTTREI